MFLVVFVMSIEDLDLVDTAKQLEWVFMVFPHFALSHSMNNLNMVSTVSRICTEVCDTLAVCDMELLCQMESSCCSTNNHNYEFLLPFD